MILNNFDLFYRSELSSWFGFIILLWYGMLVLFERIQFNLIMELLWKHT